MSLTDQVIVNSVRRWFEKAVLGLNLCPFAAAPYQRGSIKFVLCRARNDQGILTDLYLHLLSMDRDQKIETLIMICPDHLSGFTDYNQFLTLAEHLLGVEGWQGTYQIASFHPDYRFADTKEDDRENWTNRSPFPLLHLIRESSISHLVDRDVRVDQVPLNNVRTLNQLDEEQMEDIFGYRSRPKKIPE